MNPESPSFEEISTCVHCGLCLEACPTYKELRVEMDSPRGRIYLMKGILNESIEPTPTVLRHLDQCLDCRACETACPSGVPYSSIIEATRTVLEPQRSRSLTARLVRWFLFEKLLPSRGLQSAVFKMLWIQQTLGLTALGRFMPGKLGAAARQAPHVPFRSFRAGGLTSFPARGERRARVALFTGCLADQLLAGVNAAAIRVLTENGCDVELAPDESCCGALHIHNGVKDQARDLARRNIDAFRGYDAVISTAAGCSAELRHYGALLRGEPEGEAFGKKIRDVAEFLIDLGWRPPRGRLFGKLAYDEPCHLLHAQKISAAPKALLAAIPGLEAVVLADAEACCGSAGIYSVTEPDLANRILARKIEAIRASGADIVATGNPGCILQIRAGVREAGLPVRVVHPVELLAESYSGESA